MFSDKALTVKYLPAGRQVSVFFRPVALATYLKKNFVLTFKPLSSIINIILKQLLKEKGRNLPFSLTKSTNIFFHLKIKMMKKIYTSLFLLFSITCAFSQVEGTWKMAPQAQALAVGPTLGDFSWWSNSAEDVNTRACFFDDEYVFNADGSFQNVQGGETWNEPWQGMDPEGCDTPVAPHDGSASATWSYDEGAGTITITGTGAYLGLAKVHNEGELASPGDAVTAITYPVVIDGNTMTIDIDFGGGFWHYVLEKSSTSVQEVVEDLFSFYPNPASTEVQINSDQQMDEIIIRDITGKSVIVKVNPSLNETINVSALPKGLYILESHTGNLISVQKLSIN